ncbi:diguanylate cyclase (GGDEF)-like protein/PAS domain S-box-containing protein [Saccharothrix ecbatanensis]|uniref:Diguanylate cyclase (GGDEF)-like protein/PAS domain S-box-containing protein n=1 Tax=Saccharothrix ecbatanensis TaxID=1105145 RepID=A0A7W9HNS7_9PSEU|nr:bifunctional diguanylate cyclase/phosphodiesterase [Saccharothrix ecbatanensis]MBB5805697.1 diguanylate cyclase (GGDEF)-like protein/PAS domain S-box-containing protein [Saccharothrix ecbatanensis]
MPYPSRRPEATPPPGRGRELLARKWSYLLSGAVVVPLTRDELDRELSDRLDELCAVLHAEPSAGSGAERAVERLGERLVGLGYVGEDGLRVTAEVLGKGLLALPEFQPVERYASRIVSALGSLACGFLAAGRRAVFEQQESMQLSMLKAVRDAQWNLKESEARFEEVATSSSSGILVVDLDGKLVRANAAIGDILGYTTEELTGFALLDLVHPDSVKVLGRALQALVEGGQERVRQPQRLLRKDGDVARISLTVSLLRGADDQPGHFVAVIEDGTELMLLQSELNRQALHDVSTGLPNRQYFSTYLESALRRADPVRGVTLFHLDVDAFGMVCNSLGRRTGERLLVHVAQRLKAVMAREKAMIARFEGDEFGILVENAVGTPDVGTIVAEINRELAEPVYFDDCGLAVSVSVGVVRRPPAEWEPANVMRAAEQALRRAKSRRRGQWELFHHGQDASDRRVDALAVAMPGAWEHGEIGVRYQPVVGLAGRALAGVAARLHWDRGEGSLDHAGCVGLAERTGLILPLGEWRLATACGQVGWWGASGFAVPLHVGLTRHQSCDGDLVRRVRRVLDDTGLAASRLVVGMPVAVLAESDAVDNLTVLAELGVGVSLEEFGLGPDDLAAASELRVGSVRVASRLVGRQARGEAEYLAGLVELVRAAGVRVLVDGVETEEQAEWWRAAGAVAAMGSLFGAPVAAGEFSTGLPDTIG